MPGQVSLGCTRMEAEQVRGSKLISDAPPQFLLQFLLPDCCLELLPQPLLRVDCHLQAERKLFLHKLLLVSVFQSKKKQTRRLSNLELSQNASLHPIIWPLHGFK